MIRLLIATLLLALPASAQSPALLNIKDYCAELAADPSTGHHGVNWTWASEGNESSLWGPPFEEPHPEGVLWAWFSFYGHLQPDWKWTAPTQRLRIGENVELLKWPAVGLEITVTYTIEGNDFVVAASYVATADKPIGFDEHSLHIEYPNEQVLRGDTWSQHDLNSDLAIAKWPKVADAVFTPSANFIQWYDHSICGIDRNCTDEANERGDRVHWPLFRLGLHPLDYKAGDTWAREIRWKHIEPVAWHWAK